MTIKVKIREQKGFKDRKQKTAHFEIVVRSPGGETRTLDQLVTVPAQTDPDLEWQGFDLLDSLKASFGLKPEDEIVDYHQTEQGGVVMPYYDNEPAVKNLIPKRKAKIDVDWLEETLKQELKLLKESLEKEKILRLLRSEDSQSQGQGAELAFMLFPEEFQKAEALTVLYFKTMFDELLDSAETAQAVMTTAGPEAINQTAELLYKLEEVSNATEFKGWAQEYIRVTGQLINARVPHWAFPLTLFSMKAQHHGEEEEFDLEAIVGPEDLFERHYVPWFLAKLLSGEKIQFGNEAFHTALGDFQE